MPACAPRTRSRVRTLAATLALALSGWVPPRPIGRVRRRPRGHRLRRRRAVVPSTAPSSAPPVPEPAASSRTQAVIDYLAHPRHRGPDRPRRAARARASRSSSGSARRPTRRSRAGGSGPASRAPTPARRPGAAHRTRRPPARASPVRGCPRNGSSRRPPRAEVDRAGAIVVDALIELGRYDEAFDAVDPSPAARRTSRPCRACRMPVSSAAISMARSTRCAAPLGPQGLPRRTRPSPGRSSATSSVWPATPSLRLGTSRPPSISSRTMPHHSPAWAGSPRRR